MSQDIWGAVEPSARGTQRGNIISSASSQSDKALTPRPLIPRRKLRHEDYTIGWICALEVEQTAALEMLDQEHANLSQDPIDSNVYNLGSIEGHNVVIAGIHATGSTASAMTITQMQRTYRNIKFGLLVGVGGGVPVTTDNGAIRLGDVVVSKPVDGNSGAVQYDRGKATDGRFECTSSLPLPPAVLLNAAQALAANRARLLQDPILTDIKRIKTGNQNLRKYMYPGRGQDRLFKKNYIHVGRKQSCDECDLSQLIQRLEDNEGDESYLRVHRGTIASGEKIIKDAVLRDQLAEQYQVLCFETEAAGITDLPFLVIRGIADYCDTHKNDKWQGYAAAAAAAYARQLICYLPIARSRKPANFDSTEQHQVVSCSDEEKIQKIVKSLKFDLIDGRIRSIKTAHDETCGWLLETPQYENWLRTAHREAHHGLLWIKGKPGAGKSTLMKFAVDISLEAEEKRSVISYFFHARGAPLEKTIVGMFRSLLYQLLTKLPQLRKIFCSPKLETWKTNDSFEWNIELLKDLFTDAVKALGESPVICFIDALDECDDDSQARRILMFFYHLCVKLAIEWKTCFRVCVTSRHYPNFSIPEYLSLNLELQDGHISDITRYVDSELRIGTDHTAQVVRTELQQKASGVFMWVVLVVGMLNKEHDEGCSPRQLQKTLQAIPDDLHMLFRNILTRNKQNNEKFLLCMQWLLFAKRLLSPEELYLAILSGTSDEDIPTREAIDIQPDRVVKYLLNCSKGLAEAIGSRNRTMQFIHQSVRDFLLGEYGLQLVDPNLGDNIIGQSHERLKQCCHNFMTDPCFGPSLSHSSTHWRSFMGYATQRILYHADVAEGEGITQVPFLEKYGTLALTTNLAASPLYAAAAANLSNLIRILPSKLSYLEAESSPWVTPLFVAISRGNCNALRAILEAQAEALPTTSRIHQLYQSLCEDIAKSKYFQDELKRKFRHVDGVSPLSYTAMYCGERMLDFLLETGRWLPDTRDQDGRTPLSNASYYSVDRKVIKLLLENPKVDPNSRDDAGRTPLSYAAAMGNTYSIIELIQDGRVDLDSRDNKGRTPLSYAAEGGNTYSIIELIQDGRVDLDSRDNEGRTPLSYAAEGGNTYSIIELIQDGRVDLDSRDNKGRTPLSYAAEGGNTYSIIELIQDGGVDLDSRDNKGRTPLSYAAEGGNTYSIIELIQDGRVDLDSRDNEGRTPLSYAIIYRWIEAVELLLRTGKVNIDCTDRHVFAGLDILLSPLDTDGPILNLAHPELEAVNWIIPPIKKK
ncbi:pfs domain-containing protein [Histoplasma capsulatum var. duboisii H88]|uniref:Pfs domain-containing protein n=1 Tax=Ajellomyces capsulatus (strain H88) TaxID=544711 RepID=F0UHI4_AJEC8|nr:pfs domain-containing protein [Histoplasma capsulatum var. duboisii H88]